jgi:REP element-mobilizing transposase RayT
LPRPRRTTPCRLHHITARGNNRRPIYEGVDDRQTFYGILGRAVQASPVLCHGDVLMGNHYHLFLEGAIEDVSALMWRVNHRYALAYNECHDRINHLFGRRFHATPIADRRGARAVAVYIALNPVRAGFCDDPRQWPFGSFAAHAGTAPPRSHLTTAFVRELFGPHQTFVDACDAAMGRHAGRPSLETLLPSIRDLTREHVAQAVRIFGYAIEEIAAYYGVSVRTLYRWVAGR